MGIILLVALACAGAWWLGTSLSQREAVASRGGFPPEYLLFGLALLFLLRGGIAIAFPLAVAAAAWHLGGKRPGPAFAGMDRAEALRILGLQEGATSDDIHAAHRRLISAIHPDQGGSSHLAAQVNRARDILIG